MDKKKKIKWKLNYGIDENSIYLQSIKKENGWTQCKTWFELDFKNGLYLWLFNWRGFWIIHTSWKKPE